MIVAEYVAAFVAQHATRVYGVCGAGAMYLNDAFANQTGLTVIPMQHEQAAAFAAEADARVNGAIGVVLVTAGPGGTNALTGVACAHIDSIPMLVIAGQVTANTMRGRTYTRQLGMNELPVADIASPITARSVTVKRAENIRYELEYTMACAMEGRRGPVFLEIPLDVQSAVIDPEKLRSYRIVAADDQPKYAKLLSDVGRVHEMVEAARRPVMIVGHGVRLADACDEMRIAIARLGAPVVSTWGGADIVPHDGWGYLGSIGIFGDRAANLAVHRADLIIAIGTRLSVGSIGHAPHLFAPNAKKIMVDIDPAEIATKDVDLGIVADAKEFLMSWLPGTHPNRDWLTQCLVLKVETVPDHHPAEDRIDDTLDTGYIGAYRTVKTLADHMTADTAIVTDVGYCYIPTFQTLALQPGQRLIHSHGVSPMGWAIPAAVGAAMARARPVVCLTGDGGAMMNLQELQTIVTHRLPIAIFVYENGGYATMKITQNNHFHREVMSGESTDLRLPDFRRLGWAFGIYTMEFWDNESLDHAMDSIMTIGSKGPILVVLHMDRHEPIMPRVMSHSVDGKLVPATLDAMWPHMEIAPYREKETQDV